MDFSACLDRTGINVKPVSVSTLWLNITRQCNQSCSHCHVGASPWRRESMDRHTLEKCLEILAATDRCREVDITGGAPELHPRFTYLVRQTRLLGRSVTVRHNLTVTIGEHPMTGTNMGYLPEFFAENRVKVLASLPHYTREETDQVRGAGVFEKSVRSMRLLNDQGYARAGSGLVLDLVHNLARPVSSGERQQLEEAFKKQLYRRYGLYFNSLITVTNIPIGRYRQSLGVYGLEKYLSRLEDNFSPGAVSGLVCRYLVSVGYDGSLYDCDFNQMLGWKIEPPAGSIYDFDLDLLLGRSIRFGRHCFGCTAGGGSS